MNREAGGGGVHELRLRTDALEWREIDDEVVALEGERSIYLAANPAATLLWRRLASGATTTELTAALVEAYGIDEARAECDVAGFLDQARELRLVVEA